MKTKNNKHVGKGSRQKSSEEQSAENGNHTKETQHGPSPVAPDTEITSETGNKYNKWN
jgi:hypothetical protein